MKPESPDLKRARDLIMRCHMGVWVAIKSGASRTTELMLTQMQFLVPCHPSPLSPAMLAWLPRLEASSWGIASARAWQSPKLQPSSVGLTPVGTHSSDKPGKTEAILTIDLTPLYFWKHHATVTKSTFCCCCLSGACGVLIR